MNNSYESQKHLFTMRIKDESPWYINKLCQKYWQLNNEFKFEHHMDDLAKELNLTIISIHKIASSHSALDVQCLECNKIFLTFQKRNRIAYEEMYQFHQGASVICEPCQLAWHDDE